jgi:Tfp pilus assembly protein PilZ
MDRFLTEEEISALLDLFHPDAAPEESEPAVLSGSLVEREFQRRFFRFSQRLPASLRVNGRSHQVELSNLSLGGVFIRSSLDIPIGKKIGLLIDLPEPPRTIALSGCVCWRKGVDGKAAGLGIRFFPLSADAIWSIIANIEQVMSREA